MLAKTDTKRKDLTQEELTYLIQVRTALETGEITEKHFEMETVWTGGSYVVPRKRVSCGTAGCIAGWMGHFWAIDNQEQGHVGANKFINLAKFDRLFYGWADNTNPKVTDGIVAINNFLDGEENPWAFLQQKDKSC